MLYIYAKFREIISNGIKLWSGYEWWTADGQTLKITDTQNFGGYNIIPATFLQQGIKMRFFAYIYLSF